MVKDSQQNTEPTVQSQEQEEGEYRLQVRLDKKLQPVLKESAQLAFLMGDITDSNLVDLINLFIAWGLAIQKRKWLDRMGYR